jgi:G3E family GTPase
MVTVVDGFNFFKDFGSPDLLMDRDLTDIDGDDRTIVNLLTDQIEFANIIILNKTDLMDDKSLGVLRSTLKRLNPNAKVIDSSYSKVDPNQILNTGLFNFEEAEQIAGWEEELNKAEHTPESEEYGISSFVYKSRKPFDPIRLYNYIEQQFPNSIIRSKGLFWLASRPDQALAWGQAGGVHDANSAGVWWSSMRFDQRIMYPSFIENREDIQSGWDFRFGDRKNELVFIGQDMDEWQIKSDLDCCLSTDDELDTDFWVEGYNDHWPIEETQ